MRHVHLLVCVYTEYTYIYIHQLYRLYRSISLIFGDQRLSCSPSLNKPLWRYHIYIITNPPFAASFAPRYGITTEVKFTKSAPAKEAKAATSESHLSDPATSPNRPFDHPNGGHQQPLKRSPIKTPKFRSLGRTWTIILCSFNGIHSKRFHPPNTWRVIKSRVSSFQCFPRENPNWQTVWGKKTPSFFFRNVQKVGHDFFVKLELVPATRMPS